MQHETHRVPVTALAFWGQDVVLAGEGGLLRAYSLQTRSLLASAQLFQRQAIHGIITYAGDPGAELLVYGGYNVCCVGLTRQSVSNVELDLGALTNADDWILHAAFCPSALDDKSNRTAALVTAHNALVQVKFGHDLKLSLDALVSGSNCILYCAQVTWLSASHCLIASGTAFGDVIVWSCFMAQDDDGPRASHQLHYAFPAHEGSVFGVELSTSDAAQAIGDRQHLLASCSDDRTIRVWDVSDLSRQAAQISEQQQETGFGAKSIEGHCPPLLAKVMGHISRIWHVRIIHRLTEGKVYILSFGEDAQCITWILEAVVLGKSKVSHQLTQMNAQRLHNGKNIWSLAIDHGQRVATGGADGALAWFHFADPRSLSSRQGEIPPPSDAASKGDNYRSYAFIGQNSVIATTDQGQLFLLRLGSGGWQAKPVSDRMFELCGYSTVASAPGVAFVAGAEGTVYSYTEHSSALQPLFKTARKVAGLFVSVTSTYPAKAASGEIDLLITNVGSTVAVHCGVSVSQHGNRVAKGNERRLSLPHGFVVTSFARHGSSSRIIIVLGSRNGSIAVYRTNHHDEQSLTPIVVNTDVHCQETVTKLVAPQHEDACASNNLYLLSTGRDGTFAVHEVRMDSTSGSFATKHQLHLPFRSNIEGLEVVTHNRIWLWGCHRKQFVVFDVSAQQEIMSVECGGVHRNWAFQSHEGGGTFIWTKASKLYFATQKHLLHQTVNSGGHGREMKSVATSPADVGLFATGAEDTDIKLNRYENGNFRCLHTLQKHITGIQHLLWSADGQYLFSSGGVEEFLVWRITTDLPHLGIGVTCESRHPKSGTSDLRIMSFDIQDQQKGDEQDSAFNITMVYSDSTIRSWQYQTQTWVLLSEGDYLTSCLTKCLHNPDHGRLITASTDGFLATWSTDNAQSNLTWTGRHKVHQSAILSAVRLYVAGVGTFILSGGDDNAIGITLFAVSGLLWTLLMPRAHAAAVTALVVVRSEDDCFWFASASIDQRVKLWRVEIDARRSGCDSIDVKLVTNVFTAVADVSSMENTQCSNGQAGLLIAGVGLDIWKVPQP